MTPAVCKYLLPIYDKPMIYYPLTTLMLAGVREILIVASPRDILPLQQALGDGARFGAALKYAPQENPGPLAQAYRIGAEFVRGHRSVAIQGDNIFYGQTLPRLLKFALERPRGATIFGYRTQSPGQEPARYGVLEFDRQSRLVSVEEKPLSPKSQWVITGLHVYDEGAAELAELPPAGPRGEADIYRHYLERRLLNVVRLGRGFAWIEAATPEAMHQAADFVRSLEIRQDVRLGYPEKVAWEFGWLKDRTPFVEAPRSSAYNRHLAETFGAEDPLDDDDL